MKFLVVLLALVASAAAISIRENIEPLSADHVDYINSQKNILWKAGHNFRGLKIKDVKRLCGTILENATLEEDARTMSTNFDASFSSLPESFDAREKWPECADSINHVRDQGSCGSCWAVAAAGAISDRTCIATKGEKKTPLSEQTLTSCCETCYETEGCQGGYPIQAYLWWIREGLVTGGDYGSNVGCRPYQVAPCEHHVEGKRPKCGDILPTPKCEQTCSTEGIDFKSDKSFGKLAFRSNSWVGEIKTEILKRGPMTASFVVYDDFFLYKDGIYHVTEGAEKVGGHAIAVVGWGRDENKNSYWLARNSWNTDWGNKGFFKIKIGDSGTGIESGFVSGIPKIPKAPKAYLHR